MSAFLSDGSSRQGSEPHAHTHAHMHTHPFSSPSLMPHTGPFVPYSPEGKTYQHPNHTSCLDPTEQ